MKIAIHQNKTIFSHSTNWDLEWVKICEKENLDYEIVDGFRTDIIQYLKENNFSCFLWHISHYSHLEMKFARNILMSISKSGISVFPDYNTSWHFDDKIAQSYLLQAINAPIPKFWIFYNQKSAIDFLESYDKYPLILKLKGGSGSTNVKLISDIKEGMNYCNQLFNGGIKSSPDILFKAKSNLKSAKNLKTIINRIKRIPDFVESYKKSRQLELEKNYVYFQEFIENENYDLKVVVVNNKLSFLNRPTRKNDFRASGGGSIEYNKKYLTNQIIKTSFEMSEKLGFQCMGYDYVIDKNTGEAKVVEISYGFSFKAQEGLEGYYDKNCNWISEPLNAPKETIKLFTEI